MTTYRIRSQLNLYDLETIFGELRLRVKFDEKHDIWIVNLMGYEQNIDRIMLNTIALSRKQYQTVN